MLFSLFGCEKPKEENKGNKAAFLYDIPFSNGTYALYVKHKEYGEFVVEDEEILKKNKDTIVVKSSFMQYLPKAFSDNTYGVILFKDKAEIKRKLGEYFKQFEIGNIATYAKPATTKFFKGNKSQIIAKLAELSSKEGIYLEKERPKYDSENREFYFNIKLPDILIPARNDEKRIGAIEPLFERGVDEKTWKKAWEMKFRNRLAKVIPSNLDFVFWIRWGFTTEPAIVQAIYDEYGHYVDFRNLKTIDKKHLKLNNFVLYPSVITLNTTREAAGQLQKIDFSSLISDEESGRTQLLELLKEKIAQSTKPQLSVEKGEIEVQFYNGQSQVGRIKEYQYRLNWIELIK